MLSAWQIPAKIGRGLVHSHSVAPKVAWIAEAARSNFLRHLASASRAYAPSERSAIEPPYDARAAMVGEQPLLQQLIDGQSTVAPISLLGRGKSSMRQLAQRLAAARKGDQQDRRPHLGRRLHAF